MLCCRRTTLEWVLRRCALAERGRLVPGRRRRGRAPRRRLGATIGPLVVARRAPRGRDRARGRRRRGQQRPAGRRPRLVRRARRRDRRGGAPDRHDLPVALLPERRRERPADGLPRGTTGRPRVRRGRRRQRHLLGHAGRGRRRRRAAGPPPRPRPVRGRAAAVPRDGAGRAHPGHADHPRAGHGRAHQPPAPVPRPTTADPLAHGFFAIGDAHTCTNPLYGRGSSLAVLQAVLVADALAAHPHRPGRGRPGLRGGQRRPGRALVRRVGDDRRRRPAPGGPARGPRRRRRARPAGGVPATAPAAPGSTSPRCGGSPPPATRSCPCSWPRR